MFEFEIIKKCGDGRTAKFSTSHGAILTPAFIPVATKAAVKTLTSNDVRRIGFPAVLANTYHLMLQPGAKLIKKLGGLHKFMDWRGPIFTDSGGYQVFSLGKGLEYGVGKVVIRDRGQGAEDKGREAKQKNKSLIKITDDGVEFRSHIDGEKICLRPEDSIKIQNDLGADIIFAFDECTSPTDNKKYVAESLKRTHEWARRSLRARKNINQALFGIVQGAEYRDLREKSAKFISALPFDGFGIGGSFGKNEMRNVLNWTIPFLPENKPRHLLGIGAVEDIFDAVERGMDTFDCVEPTRLGRHGMLLTASGKMRILNNKYRADKNPVGKNCSCELCQKYSRSYLHHLFRANEMSGPRLATLHNLTFMHKLMEGIRAAIDNKTFPKLKKKFLKNYGKGYLPPLC
jgi:queuine tRNA-ribosyltransferase/7-cyano-7-deazaguanine tRNA-ribosyltransferase